jgi:hypothetical protein
MTEPDVTPRVSDERLATIHAERPHLIIQDDEFQRLAMDLTDCRAEVARQRDGDETNVCSSCGHYHPCPEHGVQFGISPRRLVGDLAKSRRSLTEFAAEADSRDRSALDKMAKLVERVQELERERDGAHDCIAMITGDVAGLLGKERGSIAPMFVPEHFATLRNERDSALAEVERLTGERDEMRRVSVRMDGPWVRALVERAVREARHLAPSVRGCCATPEKEAEWRKDEPALVDRILGVSE